jgi:hypothetical protein
MYQCQVKGGFGGVGGPGTPLLTSIFKMTLVNLRMLMAEILDFHMCPPPLSKNQDSPLQVR